MYQGKFDAKKKRADITVKEVVAARNEASRKNLKRTDHASQRKDPKKTTRPMQVEVRPAQNKGLRKSSVVFYTIFFLFVFVYNLLFIYFKKIFVNILILFLNHLLN